jgi:hypothetical protein
MNLDFLDSEKIFEGGQTRVVCRPHEGQETETENVALMAWLSLVSFQNYQLSKSNI